MMTDNEQNLVETAMCMWEWVVEHAADPKFPEIAACLEGNGWAHVRIEIAFLAPECWLDYEKVSDTYTMCFDWDFVPEWMRENVNWSDSPKLKPERHVPVTETRPL